MSWGDDVADKDFRRDPERPQPIAEDAGNYGSPMVRDSHTLTPRDSSAPSALMHCRHSQTWQPLPMRLIDDL